MGLFDNVKSRLGFGNPSDSGGDPRDNGYAEEYYYEEGDTGRGYLEDDYRDRPAAMRSFGVDRADYYNDSHSPLVSRADVRSQPLATGNPPRRQQGRPAPLVTQRQPVAKPWDGMEESDALAFKNGLARSSNSLSQLHDTRLRMEDSGKIVNLGQRSQTATLQVAAEQYPGALEANGQVAMGQVRQRTQRRIDRIVPVTYADAEQVTQSLKKGSLVVLDLRSTRPDLAKRILDFSFGVANALNGQVERHVDRVYIFTSNGSLLESERAAIRV